MPHFTAGPRRLRRLNVRSEVPQHSYSTRHSVSPLMRRKRRGPKPPPRRQNVVLVRQNVCGLIGQFEPPFHSEPMHEVSIMQSALTLALDQAQLAHAKRICAVRLRIGKLSGVVPEALSVAFEALTTDTIAEGAELVIEPVAARFWCAACHQEFDSADLRGRCPGCGGASDDLRAGRELELASLEIDDV